MGGLRRCSCSLPPCWCRRHSHRSCAPPAGTRQYLSQESVGRERGAGKGRKGYESTESSRIEGFFTCVVLHVQGPMHAGGGGAVMNARNKRLLGPWLHTYCWTPGLLKGFLFTCKERHRDFSRPKIGKAPPANGILYPKTRTSLLQLEAYSLT